MKKRALSFLLTVCFLSVSSPAWAVKRTMDVVQLQRTTKDGLATSTYGKILTEDSQTISIKRFDGAILEYDKSFVKKVERGVEVDVPEWTARVMDQVEAAERAPATEASGTAGETSRGPTDVQLSSFDKPTAQITLKTVQKNPEGGLDLAIGLEWSGPPPDPNVPFIPVFLVIELPKKTNTSPGFALNTRLYAETMRGFLRRFIPIAVDRLPRLQAMTSPGSDQVLTELSPLINLFCDPRTELIIDLDTYLGSLQDLARGIVTEILSSPNAPMLTEQFGGVQIAGKFAEQTISQIPPGLNTDVVLSMLCSTDSFKDFSTKTNLSGLDKIVSFIREHIILIRVLPIQTSLPTQATFRGVGRFLTAGGKAKAYIVYPEPSPETEKNLIIASQSSDLMSGDSQQTAELLKGVLNAVREALSPASNVVDIQF